VSSDSTDIPLGRQTVEVIASVQLRRRWAAQGLQACRPSSVMSEI
jgi:hypothetical protein